jgi:hypothetical protein
LLCSRDDVLVLACVFHFRENASDIIERLLLFGLMFQFVNLVDRHFYNVHHIHFAIFEILDSASDVLENPSYLDNAVLDHSCGFHLADAHLDE